MIAFFLAHQTGQPGHLGWLTENRHTAADHRLLQFGRTPPQSQSVPFVQRCQQSLYNLVRFFFIFLNSLIFVFNILGMVTWPLWRWTPSQTPAMRLWLKAIAYRSASSPWLETSCERSWALLWRVRFSLYIYILLILYRTNYKSLFRVPHWGCAHHARIQSAR